MWTGISDTLTNARNIIDPDVRGWRDFIVGQYVRVIGHDYRIDLANGAKRHEINGYVAVIVEHEGRDSCYCVVKDFEGNRNRVSFDRLVGFEAAP